MAMRLIDPATEEVIKEVTEDSPSAIGTRYAEARSAQRAWAARPLEERIATIARFNELMLEESDDLCHDLTREVGKPLWQSVNEVKGARGRVKFFIEQSGRYLADEWMVTEGATREKIVYEPLGVVANISAWNYPYLVGVNAFIPALIGGNAVLYKPSELATLTGLNIGRLLHAAGVPKEVFQVVAGGREAGEALLDLPLDGYFFTGSYRTGRHIATRVAGKMVPVGLELGGKDPLYVTDDVNIDAVAEAALEGVVYNTGQSCCAVERIYVHQKVYDAFVEAFVDKAKAMVAGDVLRNETQLGPLTRKEQVAVLEAQVADATAKGARLLLGGSRLPQKGYWFPATVLADCDHRMTVMTEESFGPIIGIQQVADDQEAVRLMLDTEYGLTSAVYCRSEERAHGIMAQMDSGTVYWNCCDRLSPYLPWSGRRHSGMGSTLSYLGIRAFVRPKAYHLRNPA
jgi:acyl-CoA reductase-like NAD-dependent aldehyde dehydrogenase